MANRLGLLMAVAMSVTMACGSSKIPTAPTPPPPPPADLVATGTLTISLCFPGSITGTSTCVYTGSALNNGAGCASNVRGSTLAFNSSNTQVGASQWTYANVVRPGERFVYGGFNLNVPSGSWTYNTQVSWSNVAC